mmetsp:Transcript_4080/g.7270  ORF Transcript_4080/g.7270 Transcript_4080/m.7270 type:complete len:134 (+) Transcript_4080:849-1250(+)
MDDAAVVVAEKDDAVPERDDGPILLLVGEGDRRGRRADSGGDDGEAEHAGVVVLPLLVLHLLPMLPVVGRSVANAGWDVASYFIQDVRDFHLPLNSAERRVSFSLFQMICHKMCCVNLFSVTKSLFQCQKMLV